MWDVGSDCIDSTDKSYDKTEMRTRQKHVSFYIDCFFPFYFSSSFLLVH